MKFLGLGEGPTRILQHHPPPSPPLPPLPASRGLDLDPTAELWAEPGDGSNDGVRRAMLRHEHVFRAQLFELHRLYWTQRTLMNGFPYDEAAANHSAAAAAASDWDAHRMALPFPGRPTQDSPSISISSQTPMNFVPGWNADDPSQYSHAAAAAAFNPSFPSSHTDRRLSAAQQLFVDHHATRVPESPWCSLPPNRSIARLPASAAGPEAVDLTLGAADGAGGNADFGVRHSWPSFFYPRTGPKQQVIDLENDDSSSSDSEAVNRARAAAVAEGKGQAAAARHPSPPCSRSAAPVRASEVVGQDRRLPRPFDMNHCYQEEEQQQQQSADHYGRGHSIDVPPGSNGTSSSKPQKTVLFDLNTVQYEDSSAMIQEVENNVSSSSAGSSVIVHGVPDDGCATLVAANTRLGFISNMSVKIEVVDTFNSDFKDSTCKRTKTLMNGSEEGSNPCSESDNVQGSQVAGSSVWNCDDGRSHTNRLLLELNSVPDETFSDCIDDDDGPLLPPSSNESLSVSQPKLSCSNSEYAGLVHLASGSRVTSSAITDVLGGTCGQPSLGSTNLHLAVGREMGTSAAKRVEGERSEEDTVSSKMQRIRGSSQDANGDYHPSVEQVGLRSEPQVGLSSSVLGNKDEALIGKNDARARQQQQLQLLNSAVDNNTCGHGAVQRNSAVAGGGVDGPVSAVNDDPSRCCSSSNRHDGEAHPKDPDPPTDLMILTAAEALAHMFKTRVGASCPAGSSGAADRQELQEEGTGHDDDEEREPQCSYDSLERIVLALPESQEDECSSPPNSSSSNGDNASVQMTPPGSSSGGLRFNTRRGRQLRDFQKDILPGIVSLSRHEICEDMHAFTEIVKFEELKKNGGRPGRGASGRTSARGGGGSRGSGLRKKRSRAGAYVQRR